jgi:hypothetical protein
VQLAVSNFWAKPILPKTYTSIHIRCYSEHRCAQDHIDAAVVVAITGDVLVYAKAIVRLQDVS